MQGKLKPMLSCLYTPLTSENQLHFGPLSAQSKMNVQRLSHFGSSLSYALFNYVI